jgi:hypothetical protein
VLTRRRALIGTVVVLLLIGVASAVASGTSSPAALPAPAAPVVLSVSDNGTIEFQLYFTKA